MRDHTKLRAFEMADEVALFGIAGDLRISERRDVWTDFSNEAGSGFGSF